MSGPAKTVMFMDIARNAGWCEGEVGGRPIYGSVRLAPDGSSSAAVYAGLFKFIATRMQAFKPNLFVFEAPLDPRHMGHKTSAATIRQLVGLPAVAEGAAYLCGVHDIREADAASVRSFLLPSRPKGSGRRDKGDLKREVFRTIELLGYEPKNTDEADAIAGWLYACSILDPRVASRATPLFGNS